MSTPRTPTGRRRSRRPTLAEVITVAKDAALFTIGAALIVRQGFYVPPADFNWVVMAFGAVIAGAPGALQLWGLRTTSTAGSSEPSALDLSAPPSE